jgi:hypothetical protein
MSTSTTFNVDLNLDNYDLHELLSLFQLNYNFNIDELKNAKKIVLLTHPDKSGLDKEYFLFYCKAFRVIKNIYDFRNKQPDSLNSQNSNINYIAETEDDNGKRLLVENLLKKDKKNFHKWFNETFEKINIVDEERKTGYGNWFKSDDDIDTTSTTLNMMHQKINEKKEAMSAIVRKDDIREASMMSGYQQLDGAAPESYSSNIFSNLQYEDLKKAHTETVVPVSQNDYNKIQKFGNVEVLRRYRCEQNTSNQPLSQEEAYKYLNNKNRVDDQRSTQMAYRLAKQDEETEKANKTWWANLQLLK